MRSSVSRPAGAASAAPGPGRRSAQASSVAAGTAHLRRARTPSAPSPVTTSRASTLRLVGTSWPGPRVVPGVAEAADRQPELGDQPVAEARGVHAGDPHRAVGAAHLDPAAVGHLERAAAVGGDPRPVAVGRDRDGQHGVGVVTSGRAKSAWALVGTSSRASTSGQTTGPPAEKA